MTGLVMNKLLLIGLGTLSLILLSLASLGFATTDKETPYPQDRINPDQISVQNNQFAVKNLTNLRFVKLKNAYSMYPVLAEGSHVIETTDFTKDSLKLGDIVSFQDTDNLIIHRILEVGNDEQGWYVITKGDNNDLDDGKVRFDQLKGVVVAIIY